MTFDEIIAWLGGDQPTVALDTEGEALIREPVPLIAGEHGRPFGDRAGWNGTGITPTATGGRIGIRTIARKSQGIDLIDIDDGIPVGIERFDFE